MRSTLLVITDNQNTKKMIKFQLLRGFLSRDKTKIDRALFDEMLDRLIAHSGGDADCDHLLKKLEDSGIYKPDRETQRRSNIQQEFLDVA